MGLLLYGKFHWRVLMLLQVLFHSLPARVEYSSIYKSQNEAKEKMMIYLTAYI